MNTGMTLMHKSVQAFEEHARVDNRLTVKHAPTIVWYALAIADSWRENRRRTSCTPPHRTATAESIGDYETIERLFRWNDKRLG